MCACACVRMCVRLHVRVRARECVRMCDQLDFGRGRVSFCWGMLLCGGWSGWNERGCAELGPSFCAAGWGHGWVLQQLLFCSCLFPDCWCRPPASPKGPGQHPPQGPLHTPFKPAGALLQQLCDSNAIAAKNLIRRMLVRVPSPQYCPPTPLSHTHTHFSVYTCTWMVRRRDAAAATITRPPQRP